MGAGDSWQNAAYGGQVAGGGPGSTDQTGVPGVPGGVPVLVARTQPSGVALINGTSTILSWTAPADGNTHRVHVFLRLRVTSLETGGAIGFVTAFGTFAIFAGGAAVGVYYSPVVLDILLGSGETFSIQQTSALTAGAATLTAELHAA